MELLFVVVIAVGIGAVIRYLLPKRGTYGILLLPAISGAVTAVVWAGLLWLGWKFDGTWIWVASLAAGGAAALVTALVLPRRRMAEDARKLHELSGGLV
jgi:O-antigen/teichoic acid export membrane protein